MVVSNAAKPRPNKNSDGQPKQPMPTMSHDIHISPGKPPAPAPAPPVPGQAGPGQVNPMTNPMHPQMQSQLGTQAGQPPNPLANIQPTPTQDNRQVQERIMFKDMQPVEQAQVAQQQGLDPYAPLKMVQQQAQTALSGGPSTGPVPNMMAGPYVPPGVEGFPDDMAHLSTLMQQGYAPGASAQEHSTAQNAHAMAHAKLVQAMQNAQAPPGAEVPQPYAPSPPAPPGGQAPQVSLISSIPGQVPAGGAPIGTPPPPQGPPPGPPQGPPPGPPMGSSMGAPPQGPPPGLGPMSGGLPPQAPGAPGGIPPSLIQQLIAKHKASGALR